MQGYPICLPDSTSHSRIVLSAAPEMKFCVFQSTSRHQTAPPWPSKVPNCSPLMEYQTLGC